MDLHNISDGKSISKEDFINTYSKLYYFTTNYSVEQHIEKILNVGIKGESDLKDVIGWKTGQILMKESFKNNNSIVFKKGYYLDNDKEIKLYRNVIKLDELLRIYQSYNGKDLYLKLNEIKGIGPVYAICLLFFKKPKEYPIYDRFAFISLKCIKSAVDLWGDIKLPNYNLSNPEKAWYLYLEYRQLLNELFPEWKDDRNIDRALWSYGHLFKKVS